MFCGSLNTKSLELLDDYDLVIIVSSTYKFQLYIEDDNLKNNLMSASEICDSIPNEQLPIIFITDVPIELPENYKTINVATLKTQNIKRFIFKAFRGNNTNFENSEYIVRGLNEIGSFDFNKGNVIISSLYGNNKTLEIGRKSLSSVIGRIEEQASIAKKMINILKTNKLLNIKASGGLEKQLLSKKSLTNYTIEVTIKMVYPFRLVKI